jgi:tetratricopeptide (TPR) repeat protein
MSNLDLESKFPDLRPIQAVPPLWLWNGCGLTVYGRRDFDEETYTYVKTYCFCLLFLPLLALRAYRVADVQRGWVFLGRVPLSGLARLWNVLILAGVVAGAGGIWWHHYSNSPSYLAGQRLAEAEALAAEGQLARSAAVCREVVRTYPDHAGRALQQVTALLDGPVGQVPVAEAVGAFKVAVELRGRPGVPHDLYERGLKVAARHEPNDPKGALELVNTVAPAAADAAAPLPVRRRLLERIVKAEPADPEYASQLAVVYEAQGQRDRCEKLLAPLKDRLGLTEGARVLGQLYVRQGKFDAAYALLQPYAEGRLKKLHAAEKAYADALRNVEKRAMDRLKGRQAPGFDYQAYNRASKDRQRAMIEEYLDRALRQDEQAEAALQARRREAGVVSVALDLGIVLLQRGQAKADPAARRAELEKAEKTFLAVRGAAGNDPLYRLSLGQVYYWLGKHREGRKLFDELLADRQDDCDTILAVSRVLREVGATAEARELTERAYAKAPSAAKKQEAAVFRSLLFTDLDDELTWLERCDAGNRGIQIQLNAVRGQKALQEGKNEEAVRHLRAALAGYAKVPESAGTLNNSAILYLNLYRVTGDRADIDRGLALLEKAVSLRPTDSILLDNAAHTTLKVALWDVIGPSINLQALKRPAGLELLAYLYKDRPGRDRLVGRLRKQAGFARALSYLDRLQTLAPKKGQPYAVLAFLHNFTRDAPALRGLWARLGPVDVDLADYTRKMTEYYQKANDDKLRQDAGAALARDAEALTAARKVGGITLAVAANDLARDKMSLDALGQAADPDEVVRLAEEADKAAPSEGTDGGLVAALLFRADRTLARQEPAYAALAAKGQRSLGSGWLIPLSLSRGDKLRQAVLANPDVRRAQALVKAGGARFPDDPSAWAWALLKDAYPQEAAEIARTLAKDEVGRLHRQIEEKLSPLNASYALLACWEAQAAGREAEGLAGLRRLAAKGVPLP